MDGIYTQLFDLVLRRKGFKNVVNEGRYYVYSSQPWKKKYFLVKTGRLLRGNYYCTATTLEGEHFSSWLRLGYSLLDSKKKGTIQVPTCTI